MNLEIKTTKVEERKYEHTLQFPDTDYSNLSTIQCMIERHDSYYSPKIECFNEAVGTVEFNDYTFDGKTLSPCPSYYCKTPICEKHLRILSKLFDEK